MRFGRGIIAEIIAGKDPQGFRPKVQELCNRFPLP